MVDCSSFQSARFLSQGCWGNLRGTLRLLWCIHIDEEARCTTQGGAPSVGLVDIVLFLLQMGLVCATYVKLHRAKRMQYANGGVGMLM